MTDAQMLPTLPAASKPLAENWMVVLEHGTQNALNEAVNSPQFTEEFPVTLTAAEFVDKFLARLGKNIHQSKREALTMSLEVRVKTRAQVVREILEMAG